MGWLLLKLAVGLGLGAFAVLVWAMLRASSWEPPATPWGSEDDRG